MAASVSYEKDVSPEQVEAEAAAMWQEVSEMFEDIANYNPTTALEKLQGAHREFTTAYPLVGRFMCFARSYDSRAFHKYLVYIRNNPWTSRDEYFASQAKYVVLLYKSKNKYWDKHTTRALQEQIAGELKKEYSSFTEEVSKIEKKITEEEESRKLKLREELIATYERLKHERRPLDGSIRVELSD